MTERRFSYNAHSLDASLDRWTIYDSHFNDYLRDFRRADPTDMILAALQTAESPVVLDVMAPTNTLVTLQGSLNLSQMCGLAVAFSDRRSYGRKKRELAKGIEFLERDLCNPTTFDSINEWLGDRKARVIMERGYGGLDCVPTRCSYYLFAVGRFWEMLDPNGGVLAVQLPSFRLLKHRGIDIEGWIADCRARKIKIESSLSLGYSLGRDFSIVVIQKEGSGQKLPRISEKTLSEYPEQFIQIDQGVATSPDESSPKYPSDLPVINVQGFPNGVIFSDAIRNKLKRKGIIFKKGK